MTFMPKCVILSTPVTDHTYIIDHTNDSAHLILYLTALTNFKHNLKIWANFCNKFRSFSQHNSQ